MKLLLCLLGLVLVIEGIPYFAFPDRMKKWMLMMQNIPDRYLRIIGLFSMSIGLLMAYFFR